MSSLGILLLVTCVTVGEAIERHFTAQDKTQRMMLSIGEEYTVSSRVQCSMRCTRSQKVCYSFMYDKMSGKCQLGSWLVPTNQSVPQPQPPLHSDSQLCNTRENVTLLANGNLSSCDVTACAGNSINIGNNPTFDPQSIPIYKTCRDVPSGNSRQVVRLTSGLVVMCDTTTSGGGWTVIQRRVSDDVSFRRGWQDYKKGFGDYGNGNFYLGNENIYCISSKSVHELRIDITYNGGSYYQVYSGFQLSDESLNYKLQFTSTYGDAGDGLDIHKDQGFSTFDWANTGCANNAGWWFENCQHSNLNGEFGSTVDAQGFVTQRATQSSSAVFILLYLYLDANASHIHWSSSEMSAP
ncbi:fibrinogen-like protein A [Physella acuta]|uniref:fibrinogen-like protein A n=1 Tax=Physella acuta TaxID=109671 RepID=UPI0027DB744D|nr:fibrinogen-like protein A [Physella acuta]